VTNLNKILVYIDGTQESVTAAQYAICLACHFDAELVALYVINTKAIADLLKARIFHQAEHLEYQRDIEADALHYLNFVEDLAVKKGLKLTKITAKGSVNNEIVTIAKKGVDLVIFGELSRIISRRDELYSDIERAVRNVTCSVLIVKDEEKVLEMYNSLV
jgi:nucleotide-binding universal stress UspA family protein